MPVNIRHLALRSLVALAICIATGFALLCLAYVIPTASMADHMAESAAIFEGEGTYPVVSDRTASTLDNFTDSKMLLAAAYDGDEGLIERVVMGYSRRLESTGPVETLVHIYDPEAFPTDEEPVVTDYARYWQGYLVILKPLLALFNYGQIRTINLCAQIGVLAVTLIALWRREQRHLIIPLLIAIATIAPLAVSRSLQFSSAFYIALVGCAIAASSRFSAADDPSGESAMILILVIGAATSYFDFLTYPVFTLGLPLVVLISARRFASWRHALAFAIGACAFWAIGYGLMWASKWLLGALLLLDPSIISDAFSQVAYRSTANVSNSMAAIENLSIGEVVSTNLSTYLSWFTKRLLLVSSVVYVALFVRRLVMDGSVESSLVGRLQRRFRNLCHKAPALLMVVVVPLIWYAVVANHSFVHSFFTYRILAVSVFAILTLMATLALYDDSSVQLKASKES